LAQNVGTTLLQVRPFVAQSASVSQQRGPNPATPQCVVPSTAVTVEQKAAAWAVSQAPQACVLHGRVSSVLGHPRPPHDAGTTTERVRVCVPPPHAWLHTVHA
jgi:hypothetical protein